MLRLLAAVLAVPLLLPAQEGYRAPPEPLRSYIDAPFPPSVSASPDGSHALVAWREGMPGIAALASPYLSLAGLRVDPVSYGPQRSTRTVKLELIRIADGNRRPLAVAVAEPDLSAPTWTADGSRFAFVHTGDDGLELWIADVATATARRVPGVVLNAVLGVGMRWMPDQRTLLCALRVPGEPPAEPRVPDGPLVQESSGVSAPVRTYQDLLEDAHDAALFAHYGRSQLALIDPEHGVAQEIAAPDLWLDADPSPDGRMVLTTRIEPPFSYLVPYRSFPQVTEVHALAGGARTVVASRPLAERVPIGGVPEGPRNVDWMPTEAATLLWVEALDGGDPERQVEARDQWKTWTAPFAAAPEAWLRTTDRAAGLQFAANGELALAFERDWKSRRERWLVADPRGSRELPPATLIERSTQDAYGDPGRPLSTVDARGRRVLRQSADGGLLLDGRGFGPDGQRPFLDRWQPQAGGAKQRLFHSSADRFEQVEAVLDREGRRLLVQREAPTEPPSWWVVEGDAERLLLRFDDPLVEVAERIEKKLLRYRRKDGVDLSATLYLPANLPEGTRPPALVWAYPREYGSRSDAAQVRAAPTRYVRPTGSSPLLLALCGYAVLDDASMPIVGPVKGANDTFLEQLVQNAEAAIAVLAEHGVDTDRVAIAGHSYGAFMTANLLAHSDLFRAGIARSGAYNRSLTPFGFQNERRTFWEATDLYVRMSPFSFAHRIDEPLLLIHGTDDNNSGTFPIQSERLYHAIKGNGGVARLVMLPHESHGYRARESVLHVAAETLDWLEKHVAHAGARDAAGSVPAAAERKGR